MDQDRIRMTAIASGVLLYTGIQASDILNYWRTNPYDRWGWLAFIIWCLPIGLSFLHRRFGAGASRPTAPLLGLGLAVSLLGTMGDLSLFKFFGFALSLAAIVPWRWSNLVWIATCVAWIHVLGYFLQWFSSNRLFIHIMRIVIALAGVLWFVLVACYSSRLQVTKSDETSKAS
ncbi:MAG TPA: hypothetical protein P5186_20645 [Candidatus Paceibacterota bacterium]|nr:hypothetical protein [Candidatus Paceibacterota bacterium]